ncbi:putative membrane protein [Francisella tularensis subsp. tularensis]|nr:putative membrane protein [Francisella tularensis subsp. tularensis]AKU72886.1 putative membrane protein [Francisella tularensis subsp. tularensis]KFJ65626.1 putative membrane protein [Francisella tularensis]
MRIKSVIISSIGSTFETFDFHIFGLFALQISMSLLHKDSFNSSLILIFAIFGARVILLDLWELYFGVILAINMVVPYRLSGRLF